MSLKVIQWNVWYKENIEHVLDVLKPLDADVICLQELTQGYIEQTHENTWQYLAHGLGMEYRAQEIPIITPHSQWLQANAILSRLPITHKAAHWLHEPADPEDPSDQYRGYLEVAIDARGTPVTVATTHMSFNTNLAQDDELGRLLKIVKAKPGSFILTGDLNATPDTPRIAALAKVLRNAGPSLAENTWTTKHFTFGDKQVSTLDWRYDYIFASHDLTVTEAKTVETKVSDHLPVVATFAL